MVLVGDNVGVGALIAHWRERAGLNKKQLARRVGYHPTMIGYIERGESGMSEEKVRALADALNLSEEERQRLWDAWNSYHPTTAEDDLRAEVAELRAAIEALSAEIARSGRRRR